MSLSSILKRWWFLALALLLATKSIFFTLSLGLHYGRNMGGVYSTVFFCLILVVLFQLVFRVRTLHLLWTGSLLIGLLLHGDLVYHRFYGEMLSVGMFAQAGNIRAVVGGVLSLLRVTDWLLYLDVPVLLALALRGPAVHLPGRRALGVALLVLVGLFFVRANRLGPERVLDSLRGDRYQPVMLLEMGPLHYHLQDVVGLVGGAYAAPEPLSPADQQRLIQQAIRPLPAAGASFGKYAGKNLLVIQVEALQQFVVGQRVGGEEVTPFLNRLVRESHYFPNFYHQTGPGRTSDAEFLTQNAYFGLPDRVAFWSLKGNRFHSLPQHLAAAGYATLSMHGNTGAFYERTQVHRRLGFAHSYFEGDLDHSDRVGMGISDKAFLRQALPLLQAAKKPFYGFLITLSSHYPFTDSLNGARPLHAPDRGVVGRYLESIRYTDEALEEFFAGLEAAGLLENTVVALYGDHNAIPVSDRAALAPYLGRELDDLTWLEAQRVPLLIRLPGAEGHLCEQLGGQIDLAPTLLGLLGQRDPVFFACGRDLLAEPSGRVVFRDGSWIDDAHAFVAGPSGVGGTALARSGGRVVPVAQVEAASLAARQQLQLSDSLMKHDLLPALVSTPAASEALSVSRR